MYKKIIGILVMMLLFVTASSVTGNIDIKKGNKAIPLTVNAVVWSDNFDSYILGQYLDGTPDDGGWQAFANNPGCGAYVVDDQAHSLPHSVEIIGEADIIHELSGLNSGNCTFKDWVYVPSTYTYGSFMFFLSYYKAEPENYYSQFGIIFDGNNGYVQDYDLTEKLPLVTDKWVEIRVELDFELDWFECHYNNELLIAQKWTYGYGGTHNYGFLNFAGIDLCYGFGDPIYHDDISIYGEGSGLTPNLQCEGSMSTTCKKGETLTATFTVKNIGDANSRLEWIVDEIPDFGSDWTFNPMFGKLTPEDGEITVTVTLKTPKKDGEYTGVIKVITIGNPDDYCEIPIELTVPRERVINFNLINWFLERFPILERLLNLLN